MFVNVAGQTIEEYVAVIERLLERISPPLIVANSRRMRVAGTAMHDDAVDRASLLVANDLRQPVAFQPERLAPGDEVEQCKLGRVEGDGHDARSVRSCPLPGSLWRAYWLMDFADTLPEAVQIMLHVHKKGIGVAGVYTYEIAETKVTLVEQLARQHEYPLKCTMEEA